MSRLGNFYDTKDIPDDNRGDQAVIEWRDDDPRWQACKMGMDAAFDSRLNDINTRMVWSDLMPALNSAELPSTLAKAVMLFNGKDLGIAQDQGRSSGSAVSLLLKASGADVEPTMDIGNLHKQLEAAGWQERDYEPGDRLQPGDLLFTSMDKHGRNVAIVGEDGLMYSHNRTSGRLEGRDKWSSKFSSVMRLPSRQ
ncbi:MAG TPA: hypothetical protein V6D17_22095 [Candidatus Obscuribacterales bacterium]